MQKEMRLTSSSDFANVRVLGNSWADIFFVMAACRRVHFPNNEDYQSRFGFVVSKKIGNAVVEINAKDG